ncbi:MAG: LpqB family beta-propeller domain-containing protein [Phycisphaerales bacterium]
MTARSAFVLPLLVAQLAGCQTGSARQQPGSATPALAARASSAPAGPGPATRLGFPQYPSISPDGSMIVFAFAGDLWAVPAAGGTATRLTSSPSDEDRSAFSPDGKLLAFESERDGARGIYVAPVTIGGGVLGLGAVRRITLLDKPVTLSGFSSDGASVLFAASLEPTIYRMTRMYSARLDAPPGGGSPVVRLSAAFGGAPHAAGDAILFNRERYEAVRTKYAGPAASDVYRMSNDGTFTRITTDERHDADAFALPDGGIIFASSRDGENNVYRLAAGATEPGSKPAQLTKFAVAGPGSGPNQTTIAHGVRDLSVTGWNAVFAVWDTLYVMDARQGEPKAVSVVADGDFAQADTLRLNAGRQISETALSPDGKTLAVIARGEVFVRSIDKDRPTRHVTVTGAMSPWGRCRDLAWSPDGRVLYFSSDPTGVSGIYAATVALTREELEKPKKEEPAKEAKPADDKPADPANEGEKADATKDGEKKTEAEKKSKKPDHGKRWAESLTFTVTPVLVSDREQRSPLPSPDGKRLLVTRDLGDLVAFDVDAQDSAKVAGDGRVVVPSWNDPEAQWAADSRHIVYAVEDVWFNSDIWLLDVLADGGKPVNLTRHPDVDNSPRLSADGKVLYFLSDRDSDTNGQDDVFVVNLDKKLDGLRPYELADYFKETGEAAKKRKPLGAPASAVGATGARGGAGGVAAAGGGGGAKPDAGDDKPKEDAKPAREPSPDNPLTFDADDAFLRVRRVPSLPSNVGAIVITPGGDRVIFTSSTDGTPSLSSVDYLGKDKKTVFAGGAGGLSVSLTGDKVLFTSSGAAPRGEPAADGPPRPTGGDAYLGKPAGGEAERLPVDGPLVVSIASQQKQKFIDAARLMGQRFYHPTLKGLDWKSMMARYLSLALQTRTDQEFNRVFANLLGELEGSHMGISGGRSTAGDGPSVGYLGTDARPVIGGYEITRVVANGPADRPSSRLDVGDVIVAINGKPVADGQALPALDFAAAMIGTSGQETLLDLRRKAEGEPRFVLITPISSGADTNLRYQDEVLFRRAEVERLSGGKLGYLHIRSMDLASVRTFERDLFAAADGKLGLIIDVRDNGGGFTNDILLASLAAPRHAFTASRGVDPTKVPKDAYPRDRRLIYAYNREISVLCNQHSYSNAEIFSHAIKTIKRGKVVGTETFGAVISTGAYGLIDGTTMRTPFRGWYLPDGTDMENNGCVPDIAVPQTPADEAAGRDPQLEAAVKELLTRAKEL